MLEVDVRSPIAKSRWLLIFGVSMQALTYQNTLPDHSWIKLYVNIQVDWSGGSLINNRSEVYYAMGLSGVSYTALRKLNTAMRPFSICCFIADFRMILFCHQTPSFFFFTYCQGFLFVWRKKGSKTKKRMKEEEIEKGDCGPSTRKVFFL